MIQKAFTQIFPGKQFNFLTKIKYSDAFRSYNANIRLYDDLIEVRMSKKWKVVSEEIKLGLIQTLLLKLFRKKGATTNIDLYNKFIKALPKYSIPTRIDPDLKKSFDRINKIYFNEFMELPNLVWGSNSFSKLGTYEYATDTITVSSILKNNQEFLDYIMYHELIHKKIQFFHKNGRNYSHTKDFRKLEKKFKDPHIEEKLNRFLKKSRLKRLFRFW